MSEKTIAIVFIVTLLVIGAAFLGDTIRLMRQSMATRRRKQWLANKLQERGL